MPIGIQIELYFCDPKLGVIVSPFTLSYYLLFICHHELRQFDDRDRALRHLVDVANNSEQNGENKHHSYNMAGHCLLIAGEIGQARYMFNMSRHFTKAKPPLDRYNATTWYLRQFCGQ